MSHLIWKIAPFRLNKCRQRNVSPWHIADWQKHLIMNNQKNIIALSYVEKWHKIEIFKIVIELSELGQGQLTKGRLTCATQSK